MAQKKRRRRRRKRTETAQWRNRWTVTAGHLAVKLRQQQGGQLPDNSLRLRQQGNGSGAVRPGRRAVETEGQQDRQGAKGGLQAREEKLQLLGTRRVPGAFKSPVFKAVRPQLRVVTLPAAKI